MTPHSLSPDDRRLRADFEACRVPPERLDHRAHIRLAYAFLVDNEVEAAFGLMRSALLRFLSHHAIDAAKYHETMTRAWILAVAHFMEISPACPSSDVFIGRNPVLLDSRIMLTHYSAELLFSEEARGRFVEPDADPIPRHEP